MSQGTGGHMDPGGRLNQIGRPTLLLWCLVLALAGCGSRAKAPLTAADVQAAFRAQGIQLVPFSGQLVSSSPPTVDAEIFKDDAEAKATSAPQQVDGVEVEPIAARNVLVWVDPHAPAAFRQRVDVALGALQG